MEQRAGERPAGRGQLLGKKIIHIRDTWRVGGEVKLGKVFRGGGRSSWRRGCGARKSSGWQVKRAQPSSRAAERRALPEGAT